VGLGLGWSKDEMDATGADMKHRGAMADGVAHAGQELPAVLAVAALSTTTGSSWTGVGNALPVNQLCSSISDSYQSATRRSWTHSTNPFSLLINWCSLTLAVMCGD